MKKLIALLATAGALTFAAPAFADPSWVSINQRQAQLDQRIDMGVRNGSLNRSEAQRLRGEFYQIAHLERQYRRNGLSMSERRDLDRRFDHLSAQIRYERHDRQDRGDWQNINARQAQLDRRIDQGLRNGSLSQREARSLRSEFHQIAALERRYRANGLSFAERRDLDNRFDALSNRIAYERHDRNNRRS